MVVYKCKRCGYTSSNRSYIRKHFTRVKPCSVVLEDISVVTLLSELNSLKFQKPENIRKSSKKTQKTLKLEKTENDTKINNLTPESKDQDDSNHINMVNYGKGEKKNLCSRNDSINFVTKKLGESSIFKNVYNIDPALNLPKKNAASGQKSQKNAKINFVTKKPAENSTNKCYENFDDGPIVQDILHPGSSGCSRNVSINFVTKEPPESRCIYEEHISDHTPIVQKKNAACKIGVQPNVSIDIKQGNHDELSYINHNDNFNCPDHAKHEFNNMYRKSMSCNNSGHSSNISTNKGENIYHIDNQDNSSIKYYNNFASAPIVTSHSTNKYSPSKLRKTTLNKSSYNYNNYNNNSYYNQDNDYNIPDRSHDLFYCSYCQKSFQHRQSKYRHEKNCAAKQGLEHKCSQLEEKLEEREAAIEKLKHQMEIIMDKVGGEVHNHNHNTTNYTYNIVLNAFGNESTEYINSATVKQILDQGAITSIPKLVQMLHFDPEHLENHNVRIPNRKENIAKIWDGTKWVYHDKQRTITTMTNKAYNIINTHYSEGSNKQVDEFTSQYADNDKTTIRRVNKDTELMILNNTTPNIDTITIVNK